MRHDELAVPDSPYLLRVLQVLVFCLFFGLFIWAAWQAPEWEQLDAHQRMVLEPIRYEWDNLSNAQRRRLLKIAKRYPQLSEREQARVSRRLARWTRLTPEQRREARATFLALRNVDELHRDDLKNRWRLENHR